MLVLSREVGQTTDVVFQEAVPAGTTIRIKVVEIRNGKVRLGITAPRTAVISRLKPENAQEASEGSDAVRIAPSRPDAS